MTEPNLSLSLTVSDGKRALAFYAEAFGAVETFRMEDPAGGIAHAEFEIGGAKVFLSEDAKDWHAHAMPEGATASCLFGILTDDCDASFKKAVDSGAEPLMQPTDYFWGSRSGMVKDPFGYRWNLNQAIEEVSPEEMERRAHELFAGK